MKESENLILNYKFFFFTVNSILFFVLLMETYLIFFLLRLQIVFIFLFFIFNKKNIKWLIQNC